MSTGGTGRRRGQSSSFCVQHHARARQGCSGTARALLRTRHSVAQHRASFGNSSDVEDFGYGAPGRCRPLGAVAEPDDHLDVAHRGARVAHRPAEFGPRERLRGHGGDQAVGSGLEQDSLQGLSCAQPVLGPVPGGTQQRDPGSPFEGGPPPAGYALGAAEVAYGAAPAGLAARKRGTGACRGRPCPVPRPPGSPAGCPAGAANSSADPPEPLPAVVRTRVDPDGRGRALRAVPPGGTAARLLRTAFHKETRR